jgi:hypothetical protein
MVGLGQMAACTTDDSDPEDRAGDGTGGESTGTGGDSTAAGGDSTGAGGEQSSDGTGGTASGQAGSGSGTGGSTSAGDAICANPLALGTATPGIADFEGYDGASPITGDNSWSFALGGDSSTGAYAGTFVYGDDYSVDPGGLPETYEMVEGHESTYALRVSDTMAEEFGGGMGLWLSTCLDLTAFAGISFWVRGNMPTSEGEFVVFMEETTSETPDQYGNLGTCPGDPDPEVGECVHPSFKFSVTEEWTEVQAPWSEFAAGSSMGTPVSVDGHNIWQLQFGVELEWLPDAAGEYVATPAPYELVVDSVTLY